VLGGERVVGETGLSGFGHMLAGMIPIDHLHGTREVIIG
jgi:hypothetical protein